RRLHDEIHTTSVFVTHDQEEALELADRVVVMNEGRIEQIGTPDEVYHYPANPFVMKFLGQVNLFHGRVEDGEIVLGPSAASAPPVAAAGNLHGASSAQQPSVIGYVRPHQLDIARNQNGSPSWPARVARVNAAGHQVRIEAVLIGENRPVEVVLSQERF